MYRVKSILKTIAFVLVLLAAPEAMPQTLPTTTIAVIGKEASVSYSDIAPRQLEIESRFFKTEHRPPVEPADNARLKEIELHLSISRLSEVLSNLLTEIVSSHHSITASDEEIEAVSMRYFSDQTLVSRREQLSNQLSACEKVLIAHDDQDHVYEKEIKGIITKEQWELTLFDWRTPEIREALHKEITKPLEEYRRDIEAGGFRDFARTKVLQGKLRVVIGEDLIKTDPKYAEIMKRTATPPGESPSKPLDDVDYCAEAERQWWYRTARTLGLKILDKRFSSVANEFLGTNP